MLISVVKWIGSRSEWNKRQRKCAATVRISRLQCSPAGVSARRAHAQIACRTEYGTARRRNVGRPAYRGRNVARLFPRFPKWNARPLRRPLPRAMNAWSAHDEDTAAVLQLAVGTVPEKWVSRIYSIDEVDRTPAGRPLFSLALLFFLSFSIASMDCTIR